MISIKALSYSYEAGKPVFQDFNWKVERGDSWVLLGPSGCGKTTLLYLLAGLRFPIAGQVEIDGEALTRPRPHTGLVIQDYGLLPWATVRQNVELGLRVRNFYGPDGKHTPRKWQPQFEVDPWLERLGLTPFANQFPSQISGGQRQRTAIARTLVLQPDVLLLDEPFASLDAPTRQNLQELILEFKSEQDLTLIVVTHTIEEAAILGRKILLLGKPPNRQSIILENDQGGSKGFRDSPAYLDLCRELRLRLETG